MNHGRPLVAWYGAIGMCGVLHTINPRLFDDQLIYIANHAEDRILFYDAAFDSIVERLKPRWKTIEHYVCLDNGEFEDLNAAESVDYALVDGDAREPTWTGPHTGRPRREEGR